MASAAEAKSTIESNFAAYLAELEQCASVWDKKPAGAAEGEAAWCARQVAEHIAGAGPFFAAGIANAIGVTPPALSRPAFPDLATGIAETKRSQAALIEVVSQVQDAQLTQEIENPRLGKQPIAGILGILAGHLADHANQLKTLRGA
ncbi:MAG: DinB family protein [Dehalococcoidia bacterium]|uniref:DinB family protein n=1 Tax=Candidatus Amarobacter glycogenicus TaxID=3140699 RepID=UPI0031372D65|nr:DinB family protein [Dehalococcoidia bacterium]MBK8559591.1 DinB family protein [Dehalococcoidia bacterium]